MLELIYGEYELLIYKENIYRGKKNKKIESLESNRLLKS